ncbi:MAG: Tim44/TimA family putative adaptor protein [Alphaproteobacteria bacterium]
MTITLVILALAVVFVLWRLSSILGQDQGFIPQFDRNSSPQPAKDAEADAPTPAPAAFVLNQADVDPASDFEAIESALREVSEKDRLFEPKAFLSDAGNAFEMILGAFASGDKDTLSSFVSKDVYAGFSGAIDARNAEGQHLELTLLKAPDVRYYSAEVSGNMAFVTLTVNSEQIQVTRDKEGEIINGDPNQTTSVEDHWNFSRKLGSSDPIWTLIATQA